MLKDTMRSLLMCVCVFVPHTQNETMAYVDENWKWSQKGNNLNVPHVSLFRYFSFARSGSICVKCTAQHIFDTLVFKMEKPQKPIDTGCASNNYIRPISNCLTFNRETQPHETDCHCTWCAQIKIEMKNKSEIKKKKISNKQARTTKTKTKSTNLTKW